MLAQLTERRRRIEDGEAPLGWKLGMGVPAAMAKLGTDAPLVGYLLAPARVDDGGTVSLDGWGNREARARDRGAHGRRPGPGASRADAEAAIAGLGVAIELVDLDPDADDPEAILAADIFQRHVLLGRWSRARARPASPPARSRTATRPPPRPTPPRRPATRSTSSCTSRTSSARRARRLRAGEVVICGSVVPALDVAPGDTVEVQLDPLGSLTVSFA